MPEPDEHEKFRRRLLDLAGEMSETAAGAATGAALLRHHEEHPEAARFLEGLQAGIDRVTSRLRTELDDDACPF